MGFYLANIDQWWWFLVLLTAAVALPFLIWLKGNRAGKLLEQTFGSVMAARLTSSLSGRRRLLKNALMIGGLLLAVLAAGRPQWGRGIDIPRAGGGEIVLAVDLSLSMLAEDLQPNRLAAAKDVAGQLVEAMAGDRFAVVAFAGEAFLELPLTRDQETLLRAIEDFSPDTIPVQGTNIEAALRESQNALTAGGNGESQAVAVLSDGEELQGDARSQAEVLARDGIPIFTVGLGRPRTESLVRDEEGEFFLDPEGEPIITVLDEALMRDLAAITDGAYLRGPLSEGMVSALARNIEEARGRGEAEMAGIFPRRAERYQIPLVLAVLFWLAGFFIGERGWPARPRIGVWLLVAGVGIATVGFPHSAGGNEKKEFSSAGNERVHLKVSERNQPDLEDELEQLRGRLARASCPEETGRVSLEIGRIHQVLGELEAAVSAYRSAISRLEYNARSRALTLWHSGIAEHLLARQKFSEKPGLSADWLASARQRYLEAMAVLGSSPRLAWNYEILLRDQSLLERVLSRLPEEKAKDEPMLSFDEVLETLDRLEEDIAVQPEPEFYPEEFADRLESEEEVEARIPEEAVPTPEAPPIELDDGLEITADQERELGGREVEAALEKARDREKNFRETLKQIRFRDVTAPDRQW